MATSFTYYPISIATSVAAIVAIIPAPLFTHCTSKVSSTLPTYISSGTPMLLLLSLEPGLPPSVCPLTPCNQSNQKLAKLEGETKRKTRSNCHLESGAFLGLGGFHPAQPRPKNLGEKHGLNGIPSQKQSNNAVFAVVVVGLELGEEGLRRRSVCCLLFVAV